MELDFSKYFEKYEKLVDEVETIIAKVSEEHADCIKCGEGCSDCCHAMFDLTFIEALYLNSKFNEEWQGEERSTILDRADVADRQGYKIKREAFRMSREGVRATEIMDYIGKARLRCPLLNDDDRCDMYQARPLTCRLYGIPTAIRGESHTCAKSGFEEGVQYPTVQIGKIQDRLVAMSVDLTNELRTRYTRLHEMVVPVSMALMNKYDKKELGIMNDEEWSKIESVKEAMRAPQPEPAAPSASKAPAPGDVAAQTLDCSSCGNTKGSSACGSCQSGDLSWEFGTTKGD